MTGAELKEKAAKLAERCVFDCEDSIAQRIEQAFVELLTEGEEALAIRESDTNGQWLNMIVKVLGPIPCGGTSLEIAERHIRQARQAAIEELAELRLALKASVNTVFETARHAQSIERTLQREITELRSRIAELEEAPKAAMKNLSAIERVLNDCGCTPETQLKAARAELVELQTQLANLLANLEGIDLACDAANEHVLKLQSELADLQARADKADRAFDAGRQTARGDIAQMRDELAAATAGAETMDCGHLKMFLVEYEYTETATGYDSAGYPVPVPIPAKGTYCKICREIEQAVERERDKYGKEIIHFQGFRYRRLLPPTIHPGETIEDGPEVFSQAEIEREVAGMREACAKVVDECNLEGPYQAITAGHRIRSLDSSAAARGKQAIREETLREAANEITTSQSALGGWLDSPKAVAAAILELIDKPGGR